MLTLLLDIQKFLRSFDSMELGNRALQEKYHIKVEEDFLTFDDGSTEKVWVYNYDMLRARGGVKIEDEARGLILNDKCKIVSMSFPRFFNVHEKHAADVNWESANAEFKNDGTLVVVYSYKGKYFIQTRGRANADGPLADDLNVSYYEAVTSILSKKFGSAFSPFTQVNTDEKYCWAFEYVSPVNQIVTPYEEDDLVLLAAFNKNFGREISVQYVDMFAEKYAFHRPAWKPAGSLEEVVSYFDHMGPLEEGFVVVDNRHRRIKVKNPAYMSISKAVNAGAQVSARHFAEIVLRGDGHEVASYFSKYKDILLFMQKVLEELLEEANNLWFWHGEMATRKSFADAVKHHPLSKILFLARDGYVKDMTDVTKHIKPLLLVRAAEMYHEGEFNAALEKAIGNAKKEVGTTDV